MELSSSDKERIQHQYDALAKKTLVGEAKSHRRTLAKRAAREVPFSDLSESELAQLFTTDEYESDYFRFQVSGFDVLVKNELLAEALTALPERKRDIVRGPVFCLAEELSAQLFTLAAIETRLVVHELG